MPKTTKKVYKRKSVARRPARRIPRSMTNQPEHASLSCTRSFPASTVNTIYAQLNTQLSGFPRAVNVAQSYQFYRITNIKLRVKSPYDTYINMGPTASGAYQKPYFYYMLDKSASIPTNITLEGLKQMGAKPRPLDEKAITISWKPTVLTAVATNLPVSGGAPMPSQYKSSPWLSTSANTQTPAWFASEVDHLGIYWGAFSALAGVADPITYETELEVQFEFKKPLVITSTGDTVATVLDFAQPNRSVDGVVGGPDGI